MENPNPTKYELHQEKKLAQLTEERRAKAWRKTRRLIVWLTAGAILVGIIFAVNYSFSSRGGGGVSPLSSKAEEILKPKADDWVIGDPKTAKLVLIEYSDFECPACAVYYPLTKRLLTEFPGQLAFIYRHYPWSFHLHAKEASIVAEAAGRQGKFWEMVTLLFTEQERWAKATKAGPIFSEYATKLGLDQDQFQADLNNPALAARVQRDLNEANAINVTYTPVFFLGTKLIDNPRSYDDFKSLIQKNLSR